MNYCWRIANILLCYKYPHDRWHLSALVNTQPKVIGLIPKTATNFTFIHKYYPTWDTVRRLKACETRSQHLNHLNYIYYWMFDNPKRAVMTWILGDLCSLHYLPCYQDVAFCHYYAPYSCGPCIVNDGWCEDNTTKDEVLFALWSWDYQQVDVVSSN